METAGLKAFAQRARRQLLEQVAARLEQILRTDSVELREKKAVVKALFDEIAQSSKKSIIDRVAYTWFNRFCALRFMDVNRYTRIGAVSPAAGGTQPEVLLEAKQGQIDEDLARHVNSQLVFDLLSGKRPSSDAQQEAYRMLLVGICNYYGEIMPFMFEKIEDYTELLMPLDLLSGNSVLHDVREAMTPEACQDVEVIGWLYQFYVSERHDQVMNDLKQSQKIEAEDIPAATQLFTPHWVVRYLIENTLGRLWMLNHPDSHLIDKMAYYIKPVQEETEFLIISSVEELRLLDPASGSGHMLTYAFDLLYAIYEEEGYAHNDIPKLILEKNLFGVEIDRRAGALAAFALCMKARAKDRRVFTRSVIPNICVLENVIFSDTELDSYMDAVGHDLFTAPLKDTLLQFRQAENFGSLIRPILTDASHVRNVLKERNLGEHLLLFGVHRRVLDVLKFTEFLAPHYHVVVANPPYMGGGGMNDDLKAFTRKAFLSGATDTYGCFIERCSELTIQLGAVGMITIPNWMFLSSFQVLRSKVVKDILVSSLIHNGRGVWGSDFGSCAFVMIKKCPDNCTGVYKRLFVKQGEVNPNSVLQKRFFDTQNFPDFKASQAKFLQVPGSPIVYSLPDPVLNVFKNNPALRDFSEPRKGMVTADTKRFIRYWYEVRLQSIGFNCSSREVALTSRCKWFPYMKGGTFRRWAGNMDNVVNWENDGYELLHMQKGGYEVGSTNHNLDYIFKPAITWTAVTSSDSGFRLNGEGYLFDTASGLCAIKDGRNSLKILGLLNTPIATYLLSALNPTLNLNSGNLRDLPFINNMPSDIDQMIAEIVEISIGDWNSYETSWDFIRSPFVPSIGQQRRISDGYSILRNGWRETVSRLKQLEEYNNRQFLEACVLDNELSPVVPLEKISLTCNPYYRYGSKRSEADLESLLRADTMKELVSYAVGCMFGRYSLDKPGLVLANQAETLWDYVKKVPKPTFEPDEDNVIPVLEGEWFNDDIAERFKEFLRVTFGEVHYEENLAFIEEVIGRDIRSYFVKEFYKEHVQMYKKRPIYWMFSSPKGSFNALIYIHRYQPDTVSTVLNCYLREYVKKLKAHKSHLESISASASASQSQKTKALREVGQVNKVLAELKEYEGEVLYPLATQKIKIDLDDGVKVNYAKFGTALKPIPGLSD